MPTAASTHHAKLSEAMRGDDNCHLHIGVTINLSRGMRSSLSHGHRQGVGRGRRRYTHFVRT